VKRANTLDEMQGERPLRLMLSRTEEGLQPAYLFIFRKKGNNMEKDFENYLKYIYILNQMLEKILEGEVEFLSPN